MSTPYELEYSDDDGGASPSVSQLSDTTLTDLSTLPSPVPLSVSPTAGQPVNQPGWQSSATFHSTQTFNTRIPIFRASDMQAFSSVEERSEEDLQALTFTQWLDYFLRFPGNAQQRKTLFTDQHYIDLLHHFVNKSKVSDQMKDRDSSDEQWLYSQLKGNTYMSVTMAYKVAKDRTDSGPALVSFKVDIGGKGESFTRRSSTDKSPLVVGGMRRCIPLSQLEAALELCHRGPLNVGHAGQDATWYNCIREFDGITRHLCRVYVKRCGVCQIKQPKVNRAALVPLSSKALWERVEMDLLDFSRRPSHGYKYIWHAQDHFSKWHFGACLIDKSAAEVAKCVEAMFSVTGPIQYLHCDNGGEFVKQTLTVCERWGVVPVNSSPYHPQTNGLIERSGAVIKRAIAKWEEQEQTLEWSEVLGRLIFQINCVAPRTTKKTPYELVFGMRPRLDNHSQSIPLDETTLAAVIAEEDVVRTTSNTTEVAATLLAGMQGPIASLPSQEPTSADMDSSRTPLELSRTPLDISRTPLEPSRTPEVQSPVDDVNLDADEDNATASDEDDGPVMAAALSDAAVSTYPTDEELRDLSPNAVGPISRSMAGELDAGPAKFYRAGTCGKGRCCISAYLQAVFIQPVGSTDSQPRDWKSWRDFTVTQQLARCDAFRTATRLHLLELGSTDIDNVKGQM